MDHYEPIYQTKIQIAERQGLSLRGGLSDTNRKSLLTADDAICKL